MDNELLIAAIDAAEQNAYSSEGDSQLAADRAYAIDMYNGKNLEPAPEGRSQVVDRGVFETIQWILPSLVDIFANGDDVVEISPVSEEDEPGAKQESQYLNHIILNKNPTLWLMTFITWAMDAMMTKNGYCLAYNEERKSTEVDQYERQTEQGIALLMSDKDVQVKVTAQYPDPDYVPPPPQPVIDPATGQPAVDPMTMQPMMQPPAPPQMLFDATVTRTQKERKVCYKALPPERCKISYRTPDFSISQECPYFEYYDYKTLSDLNADGFDVPDVIPDDWAIDEEEDLARDQYDEQGWRQDQNEPDETMKRYKVRMIWLLFDANEDGIAERIYVVRIGRKILYQQQVSRIPVASLVAIPNPHRHIATSIADIVADLQRIKTAILRQGLDNLYLANNPRLFVNEDKVNLDDALVSRPGGVVRGRDAVYGNDIAPLVMPFVFPQAMEGLEYMDQVRENRTGTNRYFTGIDQNALNKTATGIQQLSTMAAQRVKLIARIMGAGIIDLFSIMHELIIKGGHKKEVVKLSNRWVEIDPAQWKRRTDFRISVGYAAGNKDAMVSRLMLIANAQKEAALGGLPIVQPENIYETMIELTKASDFSAPNRFWTNPKDAPPKPEPQPDPTVIAAEQIKSQTAVETKRMDVEQKERDSIRDTQVKQLQIETDAQVKIGLAHHQAEQAKQQKQIEGEHTAGLEVLRSELNPKTTEARTKAQDSQTQNQFIQQFMQSQQQQTQAIAEMFQQVLAAVSKLNGPKKVVRGKDGKVESVVPVE